MIVRRRVGEAAVWQKRLFSELCRMNPPDSKVNVEKRTLVMKDVKVYIEENKNRFLSELFEVLRIPSISAQSEHHDDMIRCAEHLAAALVKAGAYVKGMVAIFSYNFNQSRRAFENADVELNTLTNYDTLIDVARETGYINESDMGMLKEWRYSPSTWGKKE